MTWCTEAQRYCELIQICEETHVTFAECSMVTTTLVLELDTKSIAPPIHLTIFPCKTETETN